jgi:hypothetical protein
MPQVWTARVTGLYVYPLKSARGIPLAECPIGPLGLESDREWMLVDARGRFLTQRVLPRLARLTVSPRKDCLLLGPVDQLPELQVAKPAGPSIAVDVWGHRGQAVDAGDVAADWCSRFLGQAVRLVHVGTALGRYADPSRTQGHKVPLGFSDGYPVLVANQSSLDALVQQAGLAFDMRSFRPNIVLSGLPPWAEDEIDTLQVNGVTLKLCKPCVRCTIPSIDQTTGEPGPDPGPILKELRWDRRLRGVTFGQNAYVSAQTSATVVRGAEAHCQRRSSDDSGTP